jgi:hypothetical protein
MLRTGARWPITCKTAFSKLMTDLRVPTVNVPVEIRCVDGRCLAGEIFLPAYSSRHPGPMRPGEWSDTTLPFFPFRSRDANRLTILNREAVVALAVPAHANAGDDVVLGDPVHVAVEAGGDRFEGDMVIDMPPEHRRVADWLNAPGAFITLRAGATHHLIQKRYVTRVVELDGDLS